MLPPTHTRPLLEKGEVNDMAAIRPTRLVVVVFPAEPVMPIVRQGQASKNICESFESGMPRRRASTTSGRLSGTPPEGQTRSAAANISSGCPPQTHLICFSNRASEARSADNCSAGRWSFKITCAPSSAR